MPTSLLNILFEVIRDIVKELFHSVRNKQDMTKEVDASTSHLTRFDFKSPKELMVSYAQYVVDVWHRAEGELCLWRAILRNIMVQNTKLPRLLAGRDCTWVSGLKDHTVPSLQHLQAALGDDMLDLLKATRPALKSLVLVEEPENDIIWERFQETYFP
ncbi:hypothetical protein M422DRAFT_268795 [Sphaerobolus stellatus SS14]|uniref:Uncharacterized protein n=1 Tax=Sphaerobolus stellatus (strain SS14) TaxID=990650 RepID=A0A0C9ULN5_SPHS4|nr:hypothetical protein M422DRAFT_268795 [Sphaerobolus stellatus SS14]